MRVGLPNTELCERISKCLIKAFRKIKRGAHRYGDELRENLLTSIVASIFFQKIKKNDELNAFNVK